MKKDITSSGFWIQFLALLGALTLIGLFITDSLFIRLTVFLDMNVGTEFMIHDREFCLWFILGFGIIALFCGLFFAYKHWLIASGAFFWLVGMALIKITLSYDELVGLHDNYIVYKEKGRLSLLNAWGNPCTDFQFDAYLRCYKDGELEDAAPLTSFVLFDHGRFYGFSKGEFFPAGQIRYQDNESDLRLINSSDQLSVDKVFAYVVIDNKGAHPTYHFFNSWGVYIGGSSSFIIADDIETDDFVLQLCDGDYLNKWNYYQVFDHLTMEARFLRCDAPDHDRVYLSNVYPSTGNALVLTSPIYWNSPFSPAISEQPDDAPQSEEKNDVSPQRQVPENSSDAVICPVCHAQRSDCGFCQGSGTVSPDMAVMMRHIMSGGSLNDFFPAGSSSASGNHKSTGSPSSRLCPTCDGKENCPVCGGLGEVTNYGETSVCKFCYSKGTCPTCMGKGTIPD